MRVPACPVWSCWLPVATTSCCKRRTAWPTSNAGVPLTLASVFDIGSTSKQFTAACVLLLQADGDLSVEDPVRRYVDELPACCDSIRLRHLLHHTSGLPDYIALLQQQGHKVVDRTDNDDALDELTGIDGLTFECGSRWQYSNSNYLLLSVIVERVSGLPLAQFARERVFEPLGMKHTHIHESCTELVPNRALAYSKSLRGGWGLDYSGWEQTGDGAVFATVGDLLTWSRNFETGDVGGPALLAAMAQPGSLDDGSRLDYGTGLIFERLGDRDVVSHGGAWAGYRAELLRVPSERLTVVCLANRGDANPSRLARRIARIALPE